MKKFLTILFTLWICSMCTICAFADTVLKGKTFDNYTDFSAGQPSTSAPEGYVYAGYRVEQTNNLMSTVTNLFVRETETPMVLHYTQANSGYLISIPGGSYYKNFIQYGKNGVGNKSETPTKQNSSSFPIATNMAFYPALKMINSATGEEINPDTAPVFELNCFPDSKGNINCSLVCISGEGSYNASIYITPTTSYTAFSSGSYTTIDTVSALTPLDEVGMGFIDTFDEAYTQYMYFQSYPWTSIIPDDDEIESIKNSNANISDVGLYPFKNSINAVKVGQMLRRSLSDTVPEQPLPSPRALINAGQVSIPKPLVGVLNVPSFRGNSSQGGVYAEDDCIIFAAVQVDGQYMLYAYHVDLSAITDQRYNWLPSGTIQTDLPAGGVTDLQGLAEFLRNVNYNNNVNNTTIYNNYMSDMEQNAPQYVLGGLRLWMPELSNEFSNLANNFGSTNFTLSDDDLGKIYGWHDDLDERIEQKFAWREVITDEVSFIYTSVLDSGSNPPVFQITLNRWGVTEPMELVDFSEVDEGTHTKIKDFITVFISISLCIYIFRSLPSTIGNEPE